LGIIVSHGDDDDGDDNDKEEKCTPRFGRRPGSGVAVSSSGHGDGVVALSVIIEVRRQCVPRHLSSGRGGGVGVPLSRCVIHHRDVGGVGVSRGGAEGGSRHCARDLWLHWPHLHVGLIDVLRARVGQEVINK